MRLFFKDLLNLPNTMSLFRIAATPLLPVLWLGLEWHVAALGVGTLVGLTDQLDGWMARKLGQTTELGALLDQLGDLVFESICLLLGVLMGEIWSGWLVIYLMREFTVNVVRAYVIGHGGSLPSTALGRVKSSCIQWAFFVFFLGGIVIQPGVVPESWSMVGVPPGRILIWVGMFWILTGIALGLISAAKYLRAFAEFYMERKAAKL